MICNEGRNRKEKKNENEINGKILIRRFRKGKGGRN